MLNPLSLSRTAIKIVVSLSLLLTMAFANAAPRISTLEKDGLFSYEHKGVALRGYDTVAYFTLGKPVEGKDEFSHQWNEATWKFSSAEHLALFKATPSKYAPQYGGYCAYGVANDSLVKIEPGLWKIIDDKLYLNYNTKFQKIWEKDPVGFIKDADAKFEKLLMTES